MPSVRTKSWFGRSRLEYVRPTAPDWTRPGGIVWVGLATWLLIHLGLYAVSAGGVPARNGGIAYEVPRHRIRAADVERVLGGVAVRDALGATVMDPDVDVIEIVAVDATGSRPRFVSSPSRPNGRRLVILLPGPDATYQDVVTALDALTEDAPRRVQGVWIAAPE